MLQRYKASVDAANAKAAENWEKAPMLLEQIEDMEKQRVEKLTHSLNSFVALIGDFVKRAEVETVSSIFKLIFSVELRCVSRVCFPSLGCEPPD